MTLRFFAAPNRYIQGAGALGQLATVLAAYGKRPFVVADATTSPETRDGVESQLRPAMESVIVSACVNGPTPVELERLVTTARALKADVAVGFGGPAAISLAKGLCTALAVPLVTVPTVPACHLPISRMIELTGERGEPGEERAMAGHPQAVLVDTALIAAAPPRLFIAGIGDSIARKFEVEQCAASGALNLFGGEPTLLANVAAETSYRTLREHASAALTAAVRHETGEPMERVVEVLILLTGIAHEGGGPSLAHALARAFAAQPACRTVLHGELVAFALLAQLIFEDRPMALLEDLVDFYRVLGLPIHLAEIGVVDGAVALVDSVARHSCHEWRLPANAKHLAEAIMRANALNSK